MKKILALAFAALIIAGCAQQEYRAPDDLGGAVGEPAGPPSTESFSEAKIRYDIIDESRKISVVIDDDGSITVIIKPTGSTRQEMRSEKIDGKEVLDMVVSLQEKNFFSFPDSFGEFGEDGTTRVLELSVDGKTKNIACQKECPENISEITEKIESIVFSGS